MNTVTNVLDLDDELFWQRTRAFREWLSADKQIFESDLRAECAADPEYADRLYQSLLEPECRERMQNFRKRIFPDRD